MISLVRTYIGSKAANYILSKLRDGNRLSAEIMSLAPSVSNVWAFTPPNLAPERLLAFDSVAFRGAEREEDPLFHVLAERLSATADACLVLEDPYTTARDPNLAVGDIPFFTYRSQVFHYLCGPQSPSSIGRLLAIAPSWQQIAVVTSGPIGIKDASDVSLRNLALATSLVIVGAWDGEGDLVRELERRN